VEDPQVLELTRLRGVSADAMQLGIHPSEDGNHAVAIVLYFELDGERVPCMLVLSPEDALDVAYNLSRMVTVAAGKTPVDLKADA
jgi:hypothetical protein